MEAPALPTTTNPRALHRLALGAQAQAAEHGSLAGEHRELAHYHAMVAKEMHERDAPIASTTGGPDLAA